MQLNCELTKQIKKEDPIKLGEQLLKEVKEGTSQTALGAKLELNRQLVGRYIKMANWKCKKNKALFKST